MSSPTCNPRQVPDVVTSEVLDELVAYSPALSQAVAMNESARAIWELCDGTRSVNDICYELSGPAGMPAEALRGDVQATVDKLGELGMLTTGSS